MPSRICIRPVLVAVIVTAALGTGRSVCAQDAPLPDQTAERSRLETAARLVAGAVVGLGVHEAGHLTANLSFGMAPGLKGVSYAGIPFFAITHDPVPPGREFIISSAGFWAQHLSSEAILTRRPRLRRERAPLIKGILAFNVVASVVYAGAAVGRTGPLERDTRGMAVSARISEPALAPVILAPAVFDTIRYLKPESRTARWASRISKIGGVLLALKARS